MGYQVLRFLDRTTMLGDSFGDAESSLSSFYQKRVVFCRHTIRLMGSLLQLLLQYLSPRAAVCSHSQTYLHSFYFE